MKEEVNLSYWHFNLEQTQEELDAVAKELYPDLNLDLWSQDQVKELLGGEYYNGSYWFSNAYIIPYAINISSSWFEATLMHSITRNTKIVENIFIKETGEVILPSKVGLKNGSYTAITTQSFYAPTIIVTAEPFKPYSEYLKEYEETKTQGETNE